jgi:hypothetical protein
MPLEIRVPVFRLDHEDATVASSLAATGATARIPRYPM